MRRTPAVVAAGIALLTAACGSAVPREATAPKPAITVPAMPLALTTIPDRFEAGGVVAASTSAVVTSRVVAPVVEIRVHAGDRVKAGQVLVRLDAREMAAQSRQAGAAIVAAEQALAQAQSEQAAGEADQTLAAAFYARMATLHARNAATAHELDEAEARRASAVARVNGARAHVEQATAAIAAARAASDAAATIQTYTDIRAPFDGIVTERLTDEGNLATPGVPLLRLDGDGPRRVEARVDEARVSLVKIGDRTDVLLDADEGGEDIALEGTVNEIARAVAADSRAFTVKIVVPGLDRVRTGSFARVRFRGAPRQMLVVPATAIRRHGQIASVFVVEDGVARLRLVQTGTDTTEGVTIAAGLDPGETVITEPPVSLMDGHPVAVSGLRARLELQP